MAAAATGSWLVYNGELYNFRELRHDLEARGCVFQSSGDTEVLLHALIQWGEDALPRFRGMYAFAFWDGRRQRLLLARDPFGIKPLFYGRSDRAIVFASELEAIRASSLLRLSLDPEAMRSFLLYGAVSEPRTMAREVVMLSPGTVVSIDGRGSASPPRRKASIEQEIHDQEPRVHRDTSDKAVAEIAALLASSVRSHLVSDVPVGIFLSGGIDSSLVASLARAASPNGNTSFLTVDLAEPGFSEVEHARTVARGLGGHHHVVRVSAREVLDLLPEALSAMGQPTVDGINTFVICKAAARLGIKVLLSGLGGDELFGGYTPFAKAPLPPRHARWASFLAPSTSLVPRRRGPACDKLRASRGVRELREAYLMQRALRWSSCPWPEPPSLVPPADFGVPPETWDAMANAHRCSTFQQVSYLELSFYMRNQLLRDADVFSSANSVELRVPFVDLAVLRAAWRIPPRDHLGRFGKGKRVLRTLLRGLHPLLEIDRRKQGFLFPWTDWLRGPFADRVRDTVSSPALYADLGLDARAGTTLLAAFEAGHPLVTWAHVWSLFVLLEWSGRRPLRS